MKAAGRAGSVEEGRAMRAGYGPSASPSVETPVSAGPMVDRAPCALAVHHPWEETRKVVGGRTLVCFENLESTEYVCYPVGPTEPWKTAHEARAAFLEGLLEDSAEESRRCGARSTDSDVARRPHVA